MTSVGSSLSLELPCLEEGPPGRHGVVTIASIAVTAKGVDADVMFSGKLFNFVLQLVINVFSPYMN